ncbi:hypothetical protein EDD18DRAFT_1048081, partial [Armillaria luteobubalina]
MQATTVIQNSYVVQIHTCMQEHEERKKRPRKKSRLNGDGRPKLVTGDAFTDRVQIHEDEAVQEEAAKEARGEAVKKYKAAVEKWKKLEESRMAINEKKRTSYQHHVTQWEKEWSCAKAEGRKIGWKKPKLADFELEKQKKKPTLKSFQISDPSEDSG